MNLGGKGLGFSPPRLVFVSVWAWPRQSRDSLSGHVRTTKSQQPLHGVQFKQRGHHPKTYSSKFIVEAAVTFFFTDYSQPRNTCLSTSNKAPLCLPFSDHLPYKLSSAPTQTRGACTIMNVSSAPSLLRVCKRLISKWFVCPPSHKSLSVLPHFFSSVGYVKMSNKPPSLLCADYEPVFARD